MYIASEVVDMSNNFLGALYIYNELRLCMDQYWNTRHCLTDLISILISQVSNYSKEVEEMKHVTKQEFIASLRRFA